MSGFIVGPCLLLHVLFTFHPLSAMDTTMSERRSYVFAGMRHGREVLRAGQVVMVGEHYRRLEGDREFRVPFRYEIVFDRQSLSFRHTQIDYEPVVVSQTGERHLTDFYGKPLPSGTTPHGEKWISRPIGGTVVHTPAFDLHLAVDSHFVATLAPGSATSTMIKEWDIRAFGVLESMSLSYCMSLDTALDAMETQLVCKSAEIDSAGLSRLCLVADTTEYEMWVDEAHGMTPVRMSRTESNGVRRETSRCNVSWQEINKCWVPVTMSIWGSLGEDEYESYDLTLEWSHVNEPLDRKIFTPAGIAESEKALVADLRLGKIIVDRVHPLPIAMPKPRPRQPGLHIGWVVVPHLIAGGLFAWWYYRRKARKPAA